MSSREDYSTRKKYFVLLVTNEIMIDSGHFTNISLEDTSLEYSTWPRISVISECVTFKTFFSLYVSHSLAMFGELSFAALSKK